MKQDRNIHILPTDKPSRLYYADKKLYLHKDCIERINYQVNIYITNDEKIKEGDWMIRDNEQPTLVTPNFFWDFGVRYYKIILTTDQELIKDGVQAIDDEFLEWFVKNPSCEEIEVEEEDYSQKCRECGEVVKRGYSCNKGCFMKSGNFIPTDENSKYKIIIPKEEPDYTALLQPVGTRQERMYSEKEVINALHSVELKYNRDFTKIYEGVSEYLKELKNK